MKHSILLMTAALLAAVSAQARVGETEKQIAARYGDAKKKAQTQRLAGAETFEYNKDDFYVEVVLLDGKSVLEIYAHKKGTTDDVIKELLKVNTSTEATWHFDRKANQWERSGTPKLVGFRWPGHPDFFCIKDLKACEAAEKKNKPSAGGL
jgi:hypothetical protein